MLASGIGIVPGHCTNVVHSKSDRSSGNRVGFDDAGKSARRLDEAKISTGIVIVKSGNGAVVVNAYRNGASWGRRGIIQVLENISIFCETMRTVKVIIIPGDGPRVIDSLDGG